MRAACKLRLHAELAGRLLLLAAALLLRPASGGDPGPSGSPVLDEAAVMSRLRQFAHDFGLVTAGMHWGGWDPGDLTHYCQWHHVRCDDSQHVTIIQMINDVNFLGGPEANRLGNITLLPLPRAVVLPPELAQLRHLEALELVVYGYAEQMPPEWGQPGAFSSLTRLVLDVLGYTSPAPLPPIEAGALQALQVMELDATQQHSPLLLPPSWGRPGVFRELQTLTIKAPVALPLPAAWSQGFPGLTRLILEAPDTKQVAEAIASSAAAAANLSLATAAKPGSAAAAAAAAAAGQASPADAAARRLPDSWAGGFPSLGTLELLGLGLSGDFPAAWADPGSFPSLRDLSLRHNNLTGPLPTRLACNLPNLASLELAENQFTGTLPPEWALCQSGLTGVHLASNQLTGPAFPAAWVAPNTSLSLIHLSLSHNRGLTGTLPAALPWNNLQILLLRNTSVSGSVPEQWCTAQFTRELRRLDFIGSNLSLALPPCAAQAMPELTLVRDTPAPPANQRKQGSAASAAVAGSGSGTFKLLLLLAGVVGTAAAAVAAAHRWQPWKRRGSGAALLSLPSLLLCRQRQRQRDTQSEEDDIELLAVAPDGQAEQLRRRQPHGREFAPGRARLKARVQQQMGRSALPSGRWEKQLLSLGAPPQELAHHLNSKLTSIRSAGSGSGSQGSSGADGGSTFTSAQRWGLESDSLRMDASDLQFIAEDDGGLVQLGEGAHGVVYLAKWQDLYVGVKVLELQPGMGSQAFWHEIALLKRCTHPRIVPVYGVAIQSQLLMVAVQLMIGGSLRAALMNPEHQQELRWAARGRQVALDVAEALVYLHEDARILHSDVKSGNVLLSQDWRAALSDFGVAQVLAGSARTAAGGSNLYAAPEQLLGRRCTLAADMYSFGLLLVELLTRRVIIRRGDWELPRPGIDCPQEVADLIDRCLLSEPLSRPSAAEALQCLRGSGSGGGSER